MVPRFAPSLRKYKEVLFFMEKLLDINNLERIVVKIGSSTITDNGRGLDTEFINNVARQVVYLRQKYDIQTLIVSSGAVASGYLIDNSFDKKSILDAQVAAIFGQPTLISTWVDAFRNNGGKAGQVLYKDDDLEGARRPLMRALEIGTVIGNGNDAVFDRETKALMEKAADNDLLACSGAYLINADLLISLTSAPGVIDRNEKVIPLIKSLGKLDLKQADKTESGTGGMETKVTALRAFTYQTDKIAVIADGRDPNIICRLAHGERIGTWFIK